MFNFFRKKLSLYHGQDYRTQAKEVAYGAWVNFYLRFVQPMRNYPTPFTPYYSSTILSTASNLSLHHIHHHHHQHLSLHTISITPPTFFSLPPHHLHHYHETKSLASFEKNHTRIGTNYVTPTFTNLEKVSRQAPVKKIARTFTIYTPTISPSSPWK